MLKNPFAALYIHVWAYINTSLRVCVCRLRCEVTVAAAWRLMQTGFHFHGGISRGGIGVLHCVKGHFGCLSWHPCAMTTTLIGAPSAPSCSFSHRFTLGWADREGANLSTPGMKLPASLRRGYLQITEAVWGNLVKMVQNLPCKHWWLARAGLSWDPVAAENVAGITLL